MPVEKAGSAAQEEPWGSRLIAPEEAAAFAATTTTVFADQLVVARNLVKIPPRLKVRGLFFDGLGRVVAADRGQTALEELRRRAAAPRSTLAFRSYPLRDYYKLYYLAARQLHPFEPMAEGIRRVSRCFFPIFAGSMLGKTMVALMGSKPTTILPLLAQAYNTSVEGTDHEAAMSGERAIIWRCRVEPVEWYEETFGGVVEGAMAALKGPPVTVSTAEKAVRETDASYTFKISW